MKLSLFFLSHFFFFTNNASPPLPVLRPPLSLSPQVQHLVPDPRVQVHVPAQLVERLARRSRRVRVEASPVAPLDEPQPAGRRQPEDAAAPPDVSGRADHGHCLVEHRLVPGLRVHVDGAEEARLGRVRVDPAQGEQPPLVLRLEDLFLCQSGNRVRGPLLLRDDERADGEGGCGGGRGERIVAAPSSADEPPREDATKLDVPRGRGRGGAQEVVEERRRDVDVPQALPGSRGRSRGGRRRRRGRERRRSRVRGEGSRRRRRGKRRGAAGRARKRGGRGARRRRRQGDDADLLRPQRYPRGRRRQGRVHVGGDGGRRGRGRRRGRSRGGLLLSSGD